MKWRVTPTGAWKRIHTADCRYGRYDYRFLDGCETPRDILRKLSEPGVLSYRWHLGCRFCCPDLDDLIFRATRKATANAVLERLAERTS